MTALLNPFWYAATGDSNFASVVLLCHCDGADGASGSSIIDSSGRHNPPAGGTMTLTTAAQKFGTASLDSSGGVLSYSDSADWDFGAGQFTVELWARRTGAVSTFAEFAGQWISGTLSNGAWVFRISPTNLEFSYSTTGADTITVTGAYVLALNTWVHVAADRDASNVLRVYADGAVIASASAAVAFFNSTRTLVVGLSQGGTRRFAGQIDDMRITKGVARYGGAFSPPTAAFPNS